MIESAEWDLGTLAEAIRTRRVSCREVMSACLDRVVGLRPSRGRVPTWPAPDQFIAQLGTAGPMARHARDCALLLSVQAGHDWRDPLAMQGNGQAFAELAARSDAEFAEGARGLRIGWLGDLDGHLATETGVLARCEAALQRLEAIGCRVEPLPAAALGVAPEALWNCWTTLRTVAVAPQLFGYVRDPARRAQLKPEAIWEAERGLAMSAPEIARASQTRTTFYQAWRRLFDRVDFLVLPAAQVFPFDVDERWPADVGGRRMDTYHRWMEVVTYATLTGTPSICVPVPVGRGATVTREDLMGIQLIGAPGDDAGVLSLAAAYQAA